MLFTMELFRNFPFFTSFDETFCMVILILFGYLKWNCSFSSSTWIFFALSSQRLFCLGWPELMGIILPCQKNRAAVCRVVRYGQHYQKIINLFSMLATIFFFASSNTGSEISASCFKNIPIMLRMLLVLCYMKSAIGYYCCNGRFHFLKRMSLKI